MPGQRRRLIVCGILATLVVGGLAGPPSRCVAAEPSGAALMDAAVEACGGRAAFDKLKTRVVKATLDLGAQGLKVQMTIYTARPNKVYSVVDLPGMGKVEAGCDGNVAWELSASGGPRIKTGAERVLVMREANQDRFAYWRDLFQTAEYAGTEELAGKTCQKIVLTPKPIDRAVEEAPHTVWIDSTSKQIVQFRQTIVAPTGTVPVTVGLGDYRKIDGVLIAHQMNMDVAGQKFVMTIDSVTNNVDLPADRFAIPPQVQDLMKEGS